MDYLENAGDVRLKPRLLKAIVRERLPDDKKSLGDFCRLSRVLSLVRTHDLLSESCYYRESVKDDGKLASSWSSAVDSWVERCVSLCSNKMPDKCWAGVSLVGLTCELCSSDRFLASYSTWFEALLSNLQPLAESDLVKLATCASMSDFFTRLSKFPHVKKDATSYASKIVLPVIHLLSDNSTDALMLRAIDLLGALLTFFPFSLHRHYERAEAVIISSLLAKNYSVDVSEKLVHCLTLLPSVRGDEDTWSTMIQRSLTSINLYLNIVFKGFEEERRSFEAMRLLVPAGKSPTPLGAEFLSTSAALKSAAELEEVVPRFSILMQSCCAMITNPLFQASLPIYSLILLVERVLSVDGSLHESLSIFSSELHQEALCQELPTLHLCSLELLMAVIRSVGSQLLPYAAHIKRIISEFFKRANFSCLRIKLYSIVRVLLMKMGVGMALHFGEEVLGHVSDDLNALITEQRSGSSNLDQVSGKNKKRKRRSDNLKEPQNVVDFGEGLLCGKAMVPLSVRVAALETVETLVTVAGPMGDHWREEVDLLLISVATNASSMPAMNKSLDLDPSCIGVNFKLAALRALLASLLSQSHIRPPYLCQGLDLFHRGSKEIGTEVAAFCAQAILGLEVLIHPRSLPLFDSPASRSFDFDPLPSQKSNVLLDLYETPLANDDFALTSGDLEPNWRESPVTVDSQVLEKVYVDPEPVKTLDKTTASEEKQIKGDVKSTASEDKEIDENDKSTASEEKQIKGNVKSTASEDKEIDENDKSTASEEKQVDDLSKGSNLRYDSPSPSLDSLPDIVDADPDSD